MEWSSFFLLASMSHMEWSIFFVHASMSHMECIRIVLQCNILKLA